MSDVTQWLLGRIIGLYLRFVRLTSRVEFLGNEEFTRNPGQPFIAAFWHDRLAMMSFVWRAKFPAYMLISRHADGKFISQIVKHLGIETIKGSTGQEGAQAFRDMMLQLQDGAVVGITPDGPRGPRHIASEGIVRLAQIMQVPVVPMSYDISRKKLLRSWDKLIVPFPFSRCVFYVGEKIAPVGEKATSQEREQMRATIEKSLSEISAACTDKLRKI